MSNCLAASRRRLRTCAVAARDSARSRLRLAAKRVIAKDIDMNPSANVQSVDGLAMFQMSLQHFQEKAKDALMNIDMDLRRTQEWLDEQYSEWKAEIRKAEDALQQAKLELNRKKMMKIGERSAD